MHLVQGVDFGIVQGSHTSWWVLTLVAVCQAHNASGSQAFNKQIVGLHGRCINVTWRFFRAKLNSEGR